MFDNMTNATSSFGGGTLLQGGGQSSGGFGHLEAVHEFGIQMPLQKLLNSISYFESLVPKSVIANTLFTNLTFITKQTDNLLQKSLLA